MISFFKIIRQKIIPIIRGRFSWAHVRRKFEEICDNYPKQSEEILSLMQQLFLVEKRAESFEELKKLRCTKSVEIVAQNKKWLEENLATARSESGFKEAIVYALKYWSWLTEFLKDEKIALTNNEAERVIRHAVMGRKNFYGSKSINGADVTAILYTIIESCKKVEIDPRSYILQTVKEVIRGDVFLTPLETAMKLRASQ